MASTNARAVPLGLRPSFGFGDRLGIATPGHVAALRRAGRGIKPIFAQQSIREMTRTHRTPKQVMDDALKGAADAGYAGEQGADADHLKTSEDVDRTAVVGFCFFTIDPSGDVDAGADQYDAKTLDEKLRPIRGEIEWIFSYRNKRIDLPSGAAFTIDDQAVARAAVKYGRA